MAIIIPFSLNGIAVVCIAVSYSGVANAPLTHSHAHRGMMVARPATTRLPNRQAEGRAHLPPFPPFFFPGGGCFFFLALDWGLGNSDFIAVRARSVSA